MSLVHSVCCQVEVSASDCSLVHSVPAEYDREASTMRMPWSPKDCRAIEENCVDIWYIKEFISNRNPIIKNHLVENLIVMQ
jgi:hypothetical protein